MNSIHQFQIEGIDGKTINFADFSGKHILVVNVASKCGYTPQYAGLQSLYEAHKDKLVIVGCPANNFGGQEPGSHEQIQNFCSVNYGVTFPMTTKVDVKTHPLFQWLTKADKNGELNCPVQWNFHKFLLDENGLMVGCFPSSVKPADIADHLN